MRLLNDFHVKKYKGGWNENRTGVITHPQSTPEKKKEKKTQTEKKKFNDWDTYRLKENRCNKKLFSHVYNNSIFT